MEWKRRREGDVEEEVFVRKILEGKQKAGF
jgi:hypothetical protein